MFAPLTFHSHHKFSSLFALFFMFDLPFFRRFGRCAYTVHTHTARNLRRIHGKEGLCGHSYYYGGWGWASICVPANGDGDGAQTPRMCNWTALDLFSTRSRKSSTISCSNGGRATETRHHLQLHQDDDYGDVVDRRQCVPTLMSSTTTNDISGRHRCFFWLFALPSMRHNRKLSQHTHTRVSMWLCWCRYRCWDGNTSERKHTAEQTRK